MDTSMWRLAGRAANLRWEVPSKLRGKQLDLGQPRYDVSWPFMAFYLLIQSIESMSTPLAYISGEFRVCSPFFCHSRDIPAQAGHWPKQLPWKDYNHPISSQPKSSLRSIQAGTKYRGEFEDRPRLKDPTQGCLNKPSGRTFWWWTLDVYCRGMNGDTRQVREKLRIWLVRIPGQTAGKISGHANSNYSFCLEYDQLWNTSKSLLEYFVECDDDKFCR